MFKSKYSTRHSRSTFSTVARGIRFSLGLLSVDPPKPEDPSDSSRSRHRRIVRSVSAAEFCRGSFTLPASSATLASGQIMYELDRTDHILTTAKYLWIAF